MQALSRRSRATPILGLLCAAGLAVPSYAQEPKTLKNLVRLVEADSANDAWSSTVQPGLAIPLQLRVLEAAPEQARQAELAVTLFSAQPPAVGPVPATIRLAGSAGGGRRVTLTLDGPRWVDVELLLDTLRPGTTYKGRLALSAGSLYHPWEITLVTPGQGSLSAETIPPAKLVTIPPCRWMLVRWLFQDCDSTGRNLSFTLTNRSEAPFSRVRIRFEPSGAPATKSTASNFSIDSFSFWSQGKRVDLERRSGGTNIQIAPQEQLTLAARVEPLSPGEYAGALRFGAAEVTGEAQEPKLALAIQVRHHWALPVLVILLGSFLGWFGSKYVVGARKTRALMLQVQDLRARADDFARSDTSYRSWHSPGEATSYSLARVRVVLSQLAGLSSSVLPMLLREEEINQRRQDAERRIAALESVRTTRLSVEPRATGRPAAQLVIGRLLRSMHGVLEGATFADVQQAELTKLLQSAGMWASDDTFLPRYREAILGRLRGPDVPTDQQIDSLPAGSALRDQIETLRKQLPTEQDITQASVQQLEAYDQGLGKLNLLWREREKPWADDLTKASGGRAVLDDLFRLVDVKAWEYLDTAAGNGELTLEREASGSEKPETYDLVILRLTSSAEHLDDRRLLFHPLHVAWRVALPDGNARSAVTPGLRLMQYFPTPGKVEVTARLRWDGREIPVKGSIGLDVVPDQKYRLSGVLADWTEYAVIVLAAGFAAATAMSSLYDATFGSFGQYLALLSWAAGAGTGGNLFKEMGTTSTVGGRADAALPAAAAGAGR